MKTKFAHATLAAWLLGCTAGGALVAASIPALAAPKGPSVSAAVAKPLSEALTFVKTKDYITAFSKLKEAQAVPGRTEFDDYRINQFLGLVAFNLNDHATADTAFEAAAESPVIPDEDRADIWHNAMGLAIEAKHYDKVIQYAAMADKAGIMDATERGYLAQAYYNKGDYANAQAVAQKSIDQDIAAGKTPLHAALDILYFSQSKQNDKASAMKTLEALAQYYGGADDWARIIETAYGLRDKTDTDTLNLLRLRVLTKATTPSSDYWGMACHALSLGYPGEALSFLQAGGAQGSFNCGGKIGKSSLADVRTRVAGDTRSLPAFDAEARKRATGDYDVKLAETYYGYGRYAEAEAAARRAMSKGGMKDTREAPMVVGMSLIGEGKSADAVPVFAPITGTSAGGTIAHLWTIYAQRKYGSAAATP